MERDASGDAINKKLLDRLSLLCPEDFDYPPGLLSILLYAIAIDSGFYLIQEDSEVQYDTALPKGWDGTSVELFQCKFHPVGYSDCICLFSNLVSGDMLISSFISQRTKSIFSKCFPIDRYVPFPNQSSLSMKFANTKELRSIFIDNVVLPVRSSELLAAGYMSGSLIGLPEEIITKIMLLCGGHSTAYMSYLNRRFRSIASNQNLWRVFYIREYYPYYVSSDKPIHNWYEKYKECHVINHPQIEPKPRIIYGKKVKK